jgi:hypothetical protein
MSRTSSPFGELAVLLALTALISAPAGAQAQQASLLGTVLADSTERPLANAEVAIATLNVMVRTDSAGNFAMPRLPAGTYQLVVRAVGRVPHRETVTFGAGDRIERDFLLRRAVNTLAEVEVRAEVKPVEMRLAEYEARRKLGFGHFITQDILEKAQGRRLADLLTSRLAGIHANTVGGERAMASSRGANSINALPAGDLSDVRRGARADCYVQVIVDGIVRYRSANGEKLFDINSVQPDQLAGVEYYTVSQTPRQFAGTGAMCGTLVIWTRMR